MNFLEGAKEEFIRFWDITDPDLYSYDCCFLFKDK